MKKHSKGFGLSWPRPAVRFGRRSLLQLRSKLPVKNALELSKFWKRKNQGLRIHLFAVLITQNILICNLITCAYMNFGYSVIAIAYANYTTFISLVYCVGIFVFWILVCWQKSWKKFCFKMAWIFPQVGISFSGFRGFPLSSSIMCDNFSRIRLSSWFILFLAPWHVKRIIRIDYKVRKN